MSDAAAYDVIDGGRVRVTLAGQAFEFGPLKVGKLPAFARAIAPMADRVNDLFAGEFSLALLLDLIGSHGDGVIDALSIATGAPRSVLEDLDAAELVELLPAVFKVNKDFLAARLTPALRAAAAQAMSRGAGLTQSPN